MERIPCKRSVIIAYSDLLIGNKITGSQLFSQVEGTLIISYHDEVIFLERNILLLELAEQLVNWIHTKNNFYYESMDYEDSPILFFKENSSKTWEIGSVWLDKIYSNLRLSDLIYACINFIMNLIHELKSKNIAIPEVFNSFMEK